MKETIKITRESKINLNLNLNYRYVSNKEYDKF